MRTKILHTNKSKDKRVLKALLIAGLSFTIIGSLLLLWDYRHTVNGQEDTNLNDYALEDVIGTATECSKDDINALQIYESFSGDREWILLGPEFDENEKTLILSLFVDSDYSEDIPSNEWDVTYTIVGTEQSGRFSSENKFKYSANLPVDDLSPGTYEVEALIDLGCGQAVRTNTYQFNVSYPLYVTWTQDWEGSEIEDQYLDQMEQISADHGIPMTHYFNPRIYVTDEISESRAQYFTDWVLRREADYGDDIGLHLHMYPDMVRAAGVTPRTNGQRWGGHSNGYDILTSDYSEEEMIQIMNWSKDIFEEKGLGDPVMYRAGGWFADEETLLAAEETGFLLDSSGRTSYTLGSNKIEGPWNLTATQKPYLMNSYDQNSTNNPNMDLWQFPNNGGDSWAFSTEELIGRYDLNYQNKPLDEKQVVTYLSHPHWFYEDKAKLETLFTEIDKDLYRSDNGPVIYITQSELYTIWTLPDGTN